MKMYSLKATPNAPSEWLLSLKGIIEKLELSAEELDSLSEIKVGEVVTYDEVITVERTH